MSLTIKVQELVIVIAIKNHNPALVTPDFLKYSGIVPAEWELARQPILTERVVQIIFTNGIGIVAEPHRIMFMEAIDGRAEKEVIIPSMTRKYVQTLPHMDYQAVGINPTGYANGDKQPDAARKYLSQTLLKPGTWQEVGTAPVRATVNYAYTLERGSFNLSVSEAILRQSEETTAPVVVFSGNFSYDITSKTGDEKLVSLYQAIENWSADLETYKEIVNNKFLTKAVEPKVVVPDIFAMSASAKA